MSKCVCQNKKGYTRLKPGMVVNVFLEQEDGTYKFESKATLIEKKQTWFTQEPFPIVDSCELCGVTTNNIKEKWLVELIPTDKFSRPLKTDRNIHRFHSYGTPHIRDEFDKKDS